eukprot:6649241-Pyramimonas_sp.AAC.1
MDQSDAGNTGIFSPVDGSEEKAEGVELCDERHEVGLHDREASNGHDRTLSIVRANHRRDVSICP